MSFHTANDTLTHSEEYDKGYYLGTVTANVDPLGLHRIQANVPGLYDTNSGEVPWIGPHKDSPFGFGTGPNGQYGTYGSPAIGSKVKIELQNGDEHNALYSPVQVLADVNTDFSAPNVWGFKDPAGNTLRVDMIAGTWTFTHQSGDQVQYQPTGDRVTIIEGNDSLAVNKKLTIIVQGNCLVQSNTRVDVQAPLTTLNSVTPI